ncbi:AraC-type DNA-binding protein [Chryseobacterium arachidis]|uniref:AraC-type DNA-binding protein n=1 Tax=Chryseobacterium arachidis TaxID=1416778 RepID=A0A1M5ICW0_9FLAO|nr:helix-turn-helix domain-containing protein [Chryseobacterium arachidis]SHG26194.1 AraC-type DNA-binding protein [Chryseobacterium arachidis]
MNLYIIALLETLIQENLSIFSLLNFVKSAVYLCDIQKLSIKLQSLADFYYDFLVKIDFLPKNSFQEFRFGEFDLNNRNIDLTVQHVLDKINVSDVPLQEAIPIHTHYMDEENIHFAAGLVRFERRQFGYFMLVDLKIAKSAIQNVPHNSHYVIELIKSYDPNQKQSLRELVSSKGLNYNQFQKDCKLCFGDTFYSFSLKLRMMESVADIVFTTMTLKEIAFKNKFLDYGNMYKTFVRYGINPTQIPRLGNL